MSSMPLLSSLKVPRSDGTETNKNRPITTPKKILVIKFCLFERPRKKGASTTRHVDVPGRAIDKKGVKLQGWSALEQGFSHLGKAKGGKVRMVRRAILMLAGEAPAEIKRVYVF
jgi:hypothetical protein